MEKAPEAIALRFRSKALTYRELNENANRIARRLQKLGVTKGARVAITLERSPDLIIALVGILKAGAGYVSLDPEYPTERLKLMLDDVKPQVIVTESKFYPVFAHCDASATLLVLDEIRDSLTETSVNIPSLCGPEDLAYISLPQALRASQGSMHPSSWCRAVGEAARLHFDSSQRHFPAIGSHRIRCIDPGDMGPAPERCLSCHLSTGIA